MTVHSCLRCGHEGTGVAVTLVNLARENNGRVRMVEVVQEIKHRHVVERVRHTVPERYGWEPRCRDRAGCDARLAADEVEL